MVLFRRLLNHEVVRNKVKYMQFKKKRHNTNPKRGPFHFRSPSRIFWRTVSAAPVQGKYPGFHAIDQERSFDSTDLPPSTGIASRPIGRGSIARRSLSLTVTTVDANELHRCDRYTID